MAASIPPRHRARPRVRGLGAHRLPRPRLPPRREVSRGNHSPRSTSSIARGSADSSSAVRDVPTALRRRRRAVHPLPQPQQRPHHQPLDPPLSRLQPIASPSTASAAPPPAPRPTRSRAASTPQVHADSFGTLEGPAPGRRRHPLPAQAGLLDPRAQVAPLGADTRGTGRRADPPPAGGGDERAQALGPPVRIGGGGAEPGLAASCRGRRTAGGGCRLPGPATPSKAPEMNIAVPTTEEIP
jgi:hypothetical protein